MSNYIFHIIDEKDYEKTILILLEAINFYANVDNWDDSTELSISDGDHIGGKRARRALEEILKNRGNNE